MHFRFTKLILLLFLSALSCSLPFALATPPPLIPPQTFLPATATLTEVPTAIPTETEPTASPTVIHPDWLSYQNDACNFQISIPPASVVSTADAMTDRIDLPFVPGTNLREKYLQVVCRGGIPNCTSPMAEGYAPGSLPSETRDINGTVFTLQGAGEGAAGNFYTWKDFSTAHADLCLSLTFVLHSVNAMNYTPPLPEFNSDEETAVFEAIIDTFGWVIP